MIHMWECESRCKVFVGPEKACNECHVHVWPPKGARGLQWCCHSDSWAERNLWPQIDMLSCWLTPLCYMCLLKVLQLHVAYFCILNTCSFLTNRPVVWWDLLGGCGRWVGVTDPRHPSSPRHSFIHHSPRHADTPTLHLLCICVLAWAGPLSFPRGDMKVLMDMYAN